jgi:hypothetical protein
MGKQGWGRRWLVRGLAVAVAGTCGLAGLGCSGDDDDGGGARRGDDGTGSDGGEAAGGDHAGGGGASDGAAMAAAFVETAEAAYGDAGLDRAEASAQGVMLDVCPVLTTDDAVAVAGALGFDDAGADVTTGNYLSGPPERELLTCGIGLPGGAGNVGVSTGSVPYDRDGALDDIRRADPQVEELQGETPGLDGADVLGVSRGQQSNVVIWVDGGFQVALSLPPGVAGAEAAFRALPVLVDAVAASLANG